jgi:hypothetical protein
MTQSNEASGLRDVLRHSEQALAFHRQVAPVGIQNSGIKGSR